MFRDQVFARRGVITTGNPLFGSFAGALDISSIVTCHWYIKYLIDMNGRFGWKQLNYIPLAVAVIGFMLLF